MSTITPELPEGFKRIRVRSAYTKEGLIAAMQNLASINTFIAPEEIVEVELPDGNWLEFNFAISIKNLTAL